MKKNDTIIRVINVMGSESATICKVEKVTKKAVMIVDSRIKYDPHTLREIDPVIPGCSCRLIRMDGQ